MSVVLPRERNDPSQYDDLSDQWWDPQGALAMLHWIAEARAVLVPRARRPGAVLVDIGCGGGILAPRIAALGYTHIGVDLTRSALDQAARHGVAPVNGNVLALPLADSAADVVCAGEILEHVTEPAQVIAEACRVLRPGGTLVVDSIADTRLAGLLVVALAEKLPRGAPPGLHDAALFVNRRALVDECARHGVTLVLQGLRPTVATMIAYWTRRGAGGRMVPTWSTAVLFQGSGIKEAQ